MSMKFRRENGHHPNSNPSGNGNVDPYLTNCSASDLCHQYQYQYQLDNVDEEDENENEDGENDTPNINTNSNTSAALSQSQSHSQVQTTRLNPNTENKKGQEKSSGSGGSSFFGLLRLSKKNKNPKKKSNSKRTKVDIDDEHDPRNHNLEIEDLETGAHLLDDEFSNGLPSDLPSDLVDIEGNIIGNISLHLGQEEGYDDEDNEDYDEEDLLHLQRMSYSQHGDNNQCNDHCEGDHDHDHENDMDELANSFGDLDRSLSMKHSSASGSGNGGANTNNTNNNNNNSRRSSRASHSLSQSQSPSGTNVRRLSVISNGRVFTHGRGYHLHNHCHRHRHGGMGRDNSTSAQSNASTSTITQHYYPEGGYGYIILFTAVLAHLLVCGLNLCAGIVITAVMEKFGSGVKAQAGWLGSCSVGLSLLFSPLWVSICKRKSTRLAAVFGGLVAALGCLFTSFATQLHQVFFSYATILGVGVGLGRDAASLMVGQYFKRKREMVEIILVSASGLGILAMSILINSAINSLGWRLGLQAVTGCLFVCFFLATFYRSASLYHPQRRAILHLKNQKRKVKDKEKRDDKPPFLDCSCLRSKTLQIILLSSSFAAFGIYTPIFYLAIDYSESVPDDSGFGFGLGLEPGTGTEPDINLNVNVSILYIYLGVAWIVGCFVFGLLVIQKSKECRVSKQYLCQVAGIICGISIITFTIVKGQSGLLIFSCIYGFSLGGYHYALKIYTYDRVRARHFPRAWSFIQSSQGLPIFFGVPLSGYLNDLFPGYKVGYYLSAVTVFLGSAFLFLADVRKFTRRKSQNSSIKTCETMSMTTGGSMMTSKSESQKTGISTVNHSSSSPSSTRGGRSRRLSFAIPVEEILNGPPDQQQSHLQHEIVPMMSDPLILDDNVHIDGALDEEEERDHILMEDEDEILDLDLGMDLDLDMDLVKELSYISEEVIADMDFQNVYWEDFFPGGNKLEIEDCLVSLDDYNEDFIQDKRSLVPLSLPVPISAPIRGKKQRKYPKFAGVRTLVQGVTSLGTRFPQTIMEEPTTPIPTPAEKGREREDKNLKSKSIKVPVQSKEGEEDSAV